MKKPSAQIILWWLAVLIPIIAATSQQTIRFKLQSADSLYPAWPIAALIHILILAALLIVQAEEPDTPTPAEPKPPTGKSGRVALYSAVTLWVGYLAYELYHLRNSLWFSPINPLQADMLPIIQQALSKFWHAGAFPYNFVEVGHWSTWLTFQPGLWIPYSIPYLCGVDIRIWQVFSLIAVCALLVFQGFRYMSAMPGWKGVSCALVPWSFPFILLSSWAFGDFFPALHVAGLWFTMALWAVLLTQGYRKMAALALGVTFITRPYMLFIGPLYLIYLWRIGKSDRKQALTEGMLATMPFLLFMAPFLLIDARSVVVGMLDAYEGLLGYQIALDTTAPDGFALSSMFFHLGIFSQKRIAALIAQGLLFIAALRYLKNDRDFLQFTAISIFLFNTFAIIPYFYIYVAPSILLGLAVPEKAFYETRRNPKLASLITVGFASALFFALISFSMLRMVPAVIPPPEDEDEEEEVSPPPEEEPEEQLLLSSISMLGGGDFVGWIPNVGNVHSGFTGEHLYLALPATDRSCDTLTLDWNVSEVEEPIVLEVALNNQFVETLTLQAGETDIFTSQMRLPLGLLFYGTNLIRISVKDGDYSTLKLARTRFTHLDE